MTISAVDLFSIGIGPSSSHTVGPIRAALRFLHEVHPTNVEITLHGSLAATGKGHGTDRAILLGLMGYAPDGIPNDVTPAPGVEIPPTGTVHTPYGPLQYRIIFDLKSLPEHPNGMVFVSLDSEGHPIGDLHCFFSIGGGFILTKSEFYALRDTHTDALPTGDNRQKEVVLPYPFSSGQEMLTQCHATGLSIAELMIANEALLHAAEGGVDYVYNHLDSVWNTMAECITQGIHATGVLPGGLGVRRRSQTMYRKLCEAEKNEDHSDGFRAMEWVNLYALAVNEQNACGGTVVTAPTNGAAGIIPAVLMYAREFRTGFTLDTAREFLLVAAAIGIIIKAQASISGAEVGCQGEVGSACSMAAAGLAHIMGGTPEQVENAAEIALEHNLGLTCDPIGGLVQIPCIERNALGAVKSINAARLACVGDGQHKVPLDVTVKTMAETGHDMLSKYKETSMGGLAANISIPVSHIEC